MHYLLAKAGILAKQGEREFAKKQRSIESTFFDFPDDVADLFSPDGALHPLPDDAHKSIKKFYAANAKGGATKIHPTMLELRLLRTRRGQTTSMPTGVPHLKENAPP